MMLPDLLLQRAKALKLHGLINHWEEVVDAAWLEKLIGWEETYRSQRSLDSRLRSARIGRFKPLADFDWTWPKRCDRDVIEEWMQLNFMKDATNVILCGPNAVGKTTIARNFAYQAILKGYTALFTTAAGMLNELAAIDSDSALRRRIKGYVQPALLIIDEVGYLSYSNRHAACVVSIIDRLVHHSEIVNIEAESFRLKEWKDNSAKKTAERARKKKPAKSEETNHA